MNILTSNESDFLKDANLRECFVDRGDVLDKVKEVPCLPFTRIATIGQVAEYFEVNKTSISKMVAKYREDFISDGYQVVWGNTLRKILVEELSSYGYSPKITKGDKWICIEHGDNKYIFSNKRNGIYHKRAILRLAMLLKDSEVAKEIRTQLLSLHEMGGK